MKLLLFVALAACVALAAADVSHLDLNRMYLPPVGANHHHHPDVRSGDDVPAHLVQTAAVVLSGQGQDEQHIAVPQIDVPLEQPLLPVAPVHEDPVEEPEILVDPPQPVEPQEPLPVTHLDADPTPLRQPAVYSPQPAPVATRFSAPAPSVEYIPPAEVAVDAPAPEDLPAPAPVVQEVLSNGIDTQYGSNGGYVY